MKYEVLNNPFYKQAVNLTEVQIFCNAPYTIITRDLVGNLTQETHEKLIKLVLDQVAAEYDPTDKINRLDQSLAKVDEKIKEIDEAIANANKQSETIQGAFLETIDLVGKLVEQVNKQSEGATNEEVATETGEH